MDTTTTNNLCGYHALGKFLAPHMTTKAFKLLVSQMLQSDIRSKYLRLHLTEKEVEEQYDGDHKKITIAKDRPTRADLYQTLYQLSIIMDTTVDSLINDYMNLVSGAHMLSVVEIELLQTIFGVPIGVILPYMKEDEKTRIIRESTIVLLLHNMHYMILLDIKQIKGATKKEAMLKVNLIENFNKGYEDKIDKYIDQTIKLKVRASIYNTVGYQDYMEKHKNYMDERYDLHSAYALPETHIHKCECGTVYAHNHSYNIVDHRQHRDRHNRLIPQCPNADCMYHQKNEIYYETSRIVEKMTEFSPLDFPAASNKDIKSNDKDTNKDKCKKEKLMVVVPCKQASENTKNYNNNKLELQLDEKTGFILPNENNYKYLFDNKFDGNFSAIPKYAYPKRICDTHFHESSKTLELLEHDYNYAVTLPICNEKGIILTKSTKTVKPNEHDILAQLRALQEKLIRRLALPQKKSTGEITRMICDVGTSIRVLSEGLEGVFLYSSKPDYGDLFRTGRDEIIADIEYYQTKYCGEVRTKVLKQTFQEYTTQLQEYLSSENGQKDKDAPKLNNMLYNFTDVLYYISPKDLMKGFETKHEGIVGTFSHHSVNYNGNIEVGGCVYGKVALHQNECRTKYDDECKCMVNKNANEPNIDIIMTVKGNPNTYKHPNTYSTREDMKLIGSQISNGVRYYYIQHVTLRTNLGATDYISGYIMKTAEQNITDLIRDRLKIPNLSVNNHGITKVYTPTGTLFLSNPSGTLTKVTQMNGMEVSVTKVRNTTNDYRVVHRDVSLLNSDSWKHINNKAKTTEFYVDETVMSRVTEAIVKNHEITPELIHDQVSMLITTNRMSVEAATAIVETAMGNAIKAQADILRLIESQAYRIITQFKKGTFTTDDTGIINYIADLVLRHRFNAIDPSEATKKLYKQHELTSQLFFVGKNYADKVKKH